MPQHLQRCLIQQRGSGRPDDRGFRHPPGTIDGKADGDASFVAALLSLCRIGPMRGEPGGNRGHPGPIHRWRCWGGRWCPSLWHCPRRRRCRRIFHRRLNWRPADRWRLRRWTPDRFGRRRPGLGRRRLRTCGVGSGGAGTASGRWFLGHWWWCGFRRHFGSLGWRLRLDGRDRRTLFEHEFNRRLIQRRRWRRRCNDRDHRYNRGSVQQDRCQSWTKMTAFLG